MIVTWCRRCRREVTTETADEAAAWMSEHECTAHPTMRQRVQLLPTNAPEPIPHGDARRYYSTTQRCRCALCTEAYLASKAPYRGTDFRIAPRRPQR